MYYTSPRRRLKKVKRQPANSYYRPPQHNARIRSSKIVPIYRGKRQQRRRQGLTVRTHTLRVLAFLACLGVIGWYSGLIPAEIAKLQASINASPSLGPAPRTALVYPGQHSIQGPPTISEAKINSILCNAGSPACGDGQALYSEGVAANINPAYALAFFQHESSFGLAGAAIYTHSLGNLRCIPNYPCPNGYASFPDWNTGFLEWYALIDSDVYVRSGRTTIETIIPRYAPAGDNNDEAAYINAVVGAVQSWQK